MIRLIINRLMINCEEGTGPNQSGQMPATMTPENHLTPLGLGFLGKVRKVVEGWRGLGTVRQKGCQAFNGSVQ